MSRTRQEESAPADSRLYQSCVQKVDGKLVYSGQVPNQETNVLIEDSRLNKSDIQKIEDKSGTLIIQNTGNCSTDISRVRGGLSSCACGSSSDWMLLYRL